MDLPGGDRITLLALSVTIDAERPKLPSTTQTSRKRPPEVLTGAELRRLIEACSARAPTGIRNRALLAVLWRCGLRVSEALNLFPRDVDLAAATLRIRHGKGDRSRTVGIDPGTQAMLERWVTKRKTLGATARDPVFCTLSGGALCTSYVRHLLRRLAVKAGVERRVHPHALRHTHAAELAREGVPINIIRDALGHTSLATTDRYLRDVAPVAVVDAMASRTWGSDSSRR